MKYAHSSRDTYLHIAGKHVVVHVYVQILFRQSQTGSGRFTLRATQLLAQASTEPQPRENITLPKIIFYIAQDKTLYCPG